MEWSMLMHLLQLVPTIKHPETLLESLAQRRLRNDRVEAPPISVAAPLPTHVLPLSGKAVRLTA